MKKIIVFATLIVLILSFNICSAEISKVNDQFTGGTVIISQKHFEKYGDVNLRALYLRKLVDGNDFKYYLKLDNDTVAPYILANKPVEIRVDDFQTNLEVENYKTIGPYSNEINAILTVKMPNELISKIKTANRVALRMTFANGSQGIYVLEDNVLEEWKKVIDIQNA